MLQLRCAEAALRVLLTCMPQNLVGQGGSGPGRKQASQTSTAKQEATTTCPLSINKNQHKHLHATTTAQSTPPHYDPAPTHLRSAERRCQGGPALRPTAAVAAALCCRCCRGLLQARQLLVAYAQEVIRAHACPVAVITKEQVAQALDQRLQLRRAPLQHLGLWCGCGGR